jgi:hypothetical protein
MDKPTDTPETIYLIPDTEHGHVWCDDPAPGLGMDPEDAIEYRRADVADTALAAAEAKLAYFEELAGERLVQISDDAERIAALEKALEPFADMAQVFAEYLYDHHRTLILVECRDARRAAALLKEKE